jgi:hypothetical protein
LSVASQRVTVFQPSHTFSKLGISFPPSLEH